jgi:proline iminopeptidase
VPALYPGIEPYDHGLLDVGDGHRVYWEQCGNPQGKPALVLHGGPGSGCTPWQRMLFDPQSYRVVLFDQRNCGRSTPHASEPVVDLSTNTTHHLVADIERLREHLGIDRWLVLGGSWGSTLALTYATEHPDRVREMVLFGVTTGRHSEIDWLFKGGVSMFFPEQWARLTAGLPAPVEDADVPAAYHRLLFDADPAVRQEAAADWCLWESATPNWPPTTGLAPRFRDPQFALAFARIVTHYVSNNCWLDDGALLANAGSIADIPGVLINGRYDFQSPIANAYALKHAWPRVELMIVDDAGHSADAAGIAEAIVRATDGFR